MDVAKFPVSRNLEALKRYPQYFLFFFFFFSQGVSSEKEIDCLQLGIIFPFIIVKK